MGAPEQHTGKSSDGGGAAASQSRIKKSGCPSSYLEARLNVADQSRRVTHQNAHGRLTPLVQARKGGGGEGFNESQKHRSNQGWNPPTRKEYTPPPPFSSFGKPIHPSDGPGCGRRGDGRAGASPRAQCQRPAASTPGPVGTAHPKLGCSLVRWWVVCWVRW